jgi:hypothetical protein
VQPTQKLEDSVVDFAFISSLTDGTNYFVR